MKVLYIGQYTEGTTSKMRALKLKKILDDSEFTVIDTHIPFYKTNKIFRTIGFRYKLGPLIGEVNHFVQKHLSNERYQLIWVDKGVYLNRQTIKTLRNKTDKMVHFTPDPAFTFHKSRLFNENISYYDYVITTKSFELDEYYKRCDKEKVIYVTQGFDKDIHKKSNISYTKKFGIAFLGHHEHDREIIIEKLLENSIPVTLAGIKWNKFSQKHAGNPNLNYLGDGVYGKDYVKTIQGAKIAWGSVSKWIPELHTTRTFEIPACGTALLTEYNKEIASYFNEDEVIFYKNDDELIKKVKLYLSDIELLQRVTTNGYNKVFQKGFDYESILNRVLDKVLNR